MAKKVVAFFEISRSIVDRRFSSRSRRSSAWTPALWGGASRIERSLLEPQPRSEPGSIPKLLAACAAESRLLNQIHGGDFELP